MLAYGVMETHAGIYGAYKHGGMSLLARNFIGTYQKSANKAFLNYLAGLGFILKKHRSQALVAESKCCRVVLDPGYIVPLVQPISADPNLPDSAYDLLLLLEASDPHTDFHGQPIDNLDVLSDEVDRMVRLLVNKCRPILEGDEAAWQRVHELSAEKEDEALARMGEAGLCLKEGDNWRELPELESIRVKGANRLATVLIALLLLIIPGLSAIVFFCNVCIHTVASG